MEIAVEATCGLDVPDGMYIHFRGYCECGRVSGMSVKVNKCTNVYIRCSKCNKESGKFPVLLLLHEYLRGIEFTTDKNTLKVLENIYENSVEGYEKLYG